MMSGAKRWYLISYDIHDSVRWSRVFKKLKGNGDHLQYSVFRVYLSESQLERLYRDIKKVLDEKDDLLVIPLCPKCAKSIRDTDGSHSWKDESPSGFKVI